MPVERVARCVDGESGTATRSSAVRASPVPRSLLEGSRGSQTRKSRCLPPIAARRAASPAGGAERADAGRALSVRTTPAKSQRGMKRHDVPFEARARPSAAALARCARGADMVTRGGGCARTSVKKRDGRRLSFADPSSGRKGTCRCETSGARATGLTRVRRQELWRAGGRLMWRRRLTSRVARSEEGPLKFDIWTVGAAFFPRNRRLGLKDRGL